MTPDKLLLDVGGTFIKCSDGREIPIDSAGSREDIVSSLRQAVGNATHLAVAIPGPFDYQNGIFLMKHKFAAVYGESFAELVGIPRENCRFTHDVVAMILGNVDENSANTALVTLGTGLGFAMFIDGKVLVNDLGSPAVSIYARPYRDGILEDYVSKRGIQNRYGDSSLTVKEIAGRALDGDQKALSVFAETGTILADNIGPILKEYGVKTVLLGGQISRSWKLFAPAMKEHLPGDIEVSPISSFDNATFMGLASL